METINGRPSLTPPSDTETALRKSVQEGRSEDVKQLLTTSIEPGLPRFALNEALADGQLQIAEYILSDFDISIDKNGAYQAVQTRDTRVVEFTLDHGWDINAMGIGWLPILASAIDDPHMLEYILSKGADPNQHNTVHDLDETALTVAAAEGNKTALKILLQHEGDARRGQLLHNAIRSKYVDEEILQLLLDNGAPLDTIEFEDHPPSLMFRGDFPRGTPLHVAAIHNSLNAARFLLDNGADPAKSDTKGKTPYDRALEKGHSDMCRLVGPSTRHSNL